MSTPKTPPVINPGVDLADHLRFLLGETGQLQEVMGGFKIRIYHTRAFPWDDVFKALLYRDFKVFVQRHKADLFIEAAP